MVVNMFIGEYEHSIDTKGRVIIPAKFRDELEETFVMTKGLDNCLFVYPKEEWEVIESKLKELPMTNPVARQSTYSSKFTHSFQNCKGRCYYRSCYQI